MEMSVKTVREGKFSFILTGWGPQDAKLVYKWLNSVVYGRYTELDNYSIHGVNLNQQTSLGGPSCTIRHQRCAHLARSWL
jgi:hypothetical protein